MKYVILADSKNTSPFDYPRQLTEINGEKLVARTIRLLKENGIDDIIITAHDKRFDGLGAKRHVPLHNEYDPFTLEGYWLNGFPEELMTEPITFLFGDVYFSEKAIKTIVETKTDSAVFFCTHLNESKKYIKHHDEPLAYKVEDFEMFKEHIARVKKMKDEGKCWREPVVWELYRDINGQDVNEHKMTENYVAINDESCDVDSINDIEKFNEKMGDILMIKVEAIREFTLNEFDELENIQRATMRKERGRIYEGDTFECSKNMADYLLGNNAKKAVVVKLLEVTPEEEPEKNVEIKEEIKVEKPAKKKKSKK